jgi:hypothetical protein
VRFDDVVSHELVLLAIRVRGSCGFGVASVEKLNDVAFHVWEVVFESGRASGCHRRGSSSSRALT